VAYVLEHAEPLLPAQRLEHTCPTKNCVNGAHYVIGRKTRKVGKKPTRIPRATKVVAAVALVRGVEPEAIAAGLGITKRQVRDAVQFVNRQLQRGKTVPELADYGFSTTTTRVLRQPPTTTSNGAHHRE
jgi:hypothetical protein